MRIAVVGGSLAGLHAAVLLRDAGFEVDLYERSPAPLSGLGTGIVVQPEVVRYLLERTATTLEEISVSSHVMRYRRADSGDLFGEVPAGWRFTSYNSLYQGLLQSFGRERYHCGRALIGLDQDADRAELRFASGERVTADLVVCADGGFSTARQRLLGLQPEYSGYVTWRGVADRDTVSGETWDHFDEAFTYGLLDDGHIIAYPIPMTSVDSSVTRGLNFQWYWNVEGAALDELMTDTSGVRRPVSVHHGALRPEVLAEFRCRAKEGLAGPFAELLHAAAEPFVTVIADSDVPTVRVGRFVLIGDAAITPRPHAAAGAAKAAADAWDLVSSLTGSADDPLAALPAWEARRLAVGRAYLHKVRRMGGVLQNGGPFEPGDPANQFGLAAARS
ncbi:NAD(P)-binding protein [Streptomyces sp. BH055]|uniref:FAD binding domain-containing protein n=1 Tax=Streptomyces sp. BH055 TaxID=3401173 RepID=UPI003BB80952